MNTDKISFTVEEAALATGMNRSRLYQAIGKHQLKTFKAGRRRMVSRKALEEFIAKLERESSKGAA
ncbi:excisionase family DNA binding protein [Lysobacter niastensis]|uniref:Excisionase family DNA binding protein n=1 Tax=Lysobacter niastensis TaxID=380629 RepID=A0ABU1WF40_9GAMM|nr:helix-turn-helix domain-containing protein [Lysobacter niastensis]MDR7136174.1 excisionase family DNA binding protein [Lysobacter niastensis]